MTVKSWIQACWSGRGWTESRLSSRKFLLVASFFIAALTLVIVTGLVFHITDNNVIITGITAVERVIIAYLAVNVVQTVVTSFTSASSTSPIVEEIKEENKSEGKDD
jgi:hypothetical protein